jgi:hypothetical protein
MENLTHEENKARMLRGDLYYAFSPQLHAERNRCHQACKRFNAAGDVSRRQLVELWREYVHIFSFFQTGPYVGFSPQAFQYDSSTIVLTIVPYCFVMLTHLSVINDKSPLPPPAATAEEDMKLFDDDPWIDGPIKADYGTNLR